MEIINRSERDLSGLKKNYMKPELLRVGLRPDEAVLGACKASGGTVGGASNGACTPGPLGCMDQGS